MQEVGFTEMLVYIYHTTWPHTLKENYLQTVCYLIKLHTVNIILNTFPPVKQMKISVSEQCIKNAMVSTRDLPSDLLISTVTKKINTFNSQ
jgi:hypothetical protein